MEAQKNHNKNNKAENTKTVEVVVTRHCMERLKERLLLLRDIDDEAVIAKLNMQLSEGIMYSAEDRNAVMLEFEGMNSRFVLVGEQDGIYYAVTFEHSVSRGFPKKGKEIKIKYKNNA
ncbi:MAG: hypothetical protein QXR73_01055 [Candidatus Micrarchaeaceae archaeon]